MINKHDFKFSHYEDYEDRSGNDMRALTFSVTGETASYLSEKCCKDTPAVVPVVRYIKPKNIIEIKRSFPDAYDTVMMSVIDEDWKETLRATLEELSANL